MLMGRKAPGTEASEAIRQMRLRDVEVNTVTCDVADPNAVGYALAAIPASQPLKGILHAAGVIEDHSLLEQSSESISAVWRPKWRGAWNLHSLTRNQKLDFFVLFSSGAALLGSPGQANYAVANAGLDALAEHRRNMGLPALSIQWGPWNAAGMAAKLRNRPESIGLGRIDPDAGIKFRGNTSHQTRYRCRRAAGSLVEEIRQPPASRHQGALQFVDRYKRAATQC